MYVAVKSAALKSSAGFFANTLQSLALGDTVSVLRHSGKWLEVRAGSVSGWMAATSLSSKRVTGSGYSVSAGEMALAGKGFTPEIEIEYKKSGLDYSGVDVMERLSIPANELLQFINEGSLTKGE
ncbi:hypothetical protein AGMMS50293_25900 [Spirochaetia bacterium]|nr:hypothetical protein AGMMS50293_25900 [Spirochaetia bacterium]